MHEEAAQLAARQRLLNAFLRETGRHDVTPGPLRIPLADGALVVCVRHRSVLGQHVYADEMFREQAVGPRVPVGHAEFVGLLLAEVAARCPTAPLGRTAELATQVDNSVTRVAAYLRRGRQVQGDPARQAEQNVLLGHPFHPTPKSAEGFGADDLARYAPELGASFVPHYFAVAAELLAERRVAEGRWVPDGVAEHCPPGYRLLPAHPWQAGYLTARHDVRALLAAGGLVSLGPLGGEVYPTSSVRTVCDPTFGTSWKLPLRVRITNFVRTNPDEHLRRATDAALVAARFQRDWEPSGFRVLLESGYRTFGPAVDRDLAAEFAVLYRDNPFAGSAGAPRVLAGLLEDGPNGAPPELVRCVRDTGDVAEWLRRYLRVSLVPLLTALARHGVSFEAHVQNSLLCLENGWPVRFWVRDLEGVSLARDRCSAWLPPDSPALYDEAEARHRLWYHAVTNQLGHVLHVLGNYEGGEEELWAVARHELATVPEAAELLAAPWLPAKANLLSRFAGRSERPLFVQVPNPLREVR